MFRSVQTISKAAIPIDYRMVLYGCGIGLACGALYLDRSFEFATAVSIATFLTASVGGFVGIKISFLAMRGFRVWIDSLMERIAANRLRLSQLIDESIDERPSKQPARRGFSMVRVYVGSTIAGISLTTQGTVAAVIELGVDIFGPLWYGPILCVGVTLAVFGIVGQAIELLLVSLRISQIERQLDAITSGVPDPVALRPQRMDHAIENTQSWVCRVTGVLRRQQGKGCGIKSLPRPRESIRSVWQDFAALSTATG